MVVINPLTVNYSYSLPMQVTLFLSTCLSVFNFWQFYVIKFCVPNSVALIFNLIAKGFCQSKKERQLL